MKRMRMMVGMLVLAVVVLLGAASGAMGQGAGQWAGAMGGLAEQREYRFERISSYDRSGGNDDFRVIEPGATLTVVDEDGPGVITHVWFTLADEEAYHLKKIVLRMYWDGEATPSVETPLGDFFGLGLGEYVNYESAVLSVAPTRALNSFFAMPFQKHARITVTNMGEKRVDAFYFNVDVQKHGKPLAAGTLYFHAQYRQAAPNRGVSNAWKENGEPAVSERKNLDGKENYVWMEATGRGQFVGVTMSVVQNQDEWWGEGDDMFFIDGEKMPGVTGTGSEDYFLGAYDFQKAFAYQLYGAPVVGEEKAGSRSSVYRFHLDTPIPFTKSLKATIEHGHANTRSDTYYSVAYWYQAEPHAAFPALPAAEERVPRLFATGGPGSAGKN